MNDCSWNDDTALQDGEKERRCAEQCTQADLPNQGESITQGGMLAFVHSSGGVRQASLALALDGYVILVMPVCACTCALLLLYLL